MTSDTLSAGGDARRLVADVRDLAQRARFARRVTWLPLLVTALVTFGAIPVYRYGHQVLGDCRVVDGEQSCRTFVQGAQFYWWGAFTLAYVVIAVGYLRANRDGGPGSRVLPYLATGGALVLLSAAATGVLLVAGPSGYPDEPSALMQFLLHLLHPAGIIAVALLVLSWLERYVALLIFALAYLAVVLPPITFGVDNTRGDGWILAPQLVISGGMLLLGSAGFAWAGPVEPPNARVETTTEDT